MAPCLLSEWILMVLATGLTASGSPGRGLVGQNVTLPCRYRVDHESDITSMCWGWGSCPISQCAQPFLWTDGWRVTWRQSNRYQLGGNLTRGDVSLTIVNAAEADKGLYCCLVEIPGWFNNEKNHLEVVIERAKTSTALPHTYPSERSSVVPKTTVMPPWLSISGSEAPQAWNVSTSVQPLEPESSRSGMYRNSIVLSLLGLLILALCIFTCYFYKTQNLETVANVS
nr:hepatitis A virus cellular receptor 1 homolog [Pelodiscus sinensis]|eukprot:XP_025034843.1 hepatitis A virus cellular receptor 1 homolog [Pelodiscus sinensis]